jgi:hypothetical protein
MKVYTRADRAVRRVVNPFSTAVTMLVQRGPRDRRPARASSVCGDWQPPWDDDGGDAGVREPRRPYPTRPSAAAALDYQPSVTSDCPLPMASRPIAT